MKCSLSRIVLALSIICWASAARAADETRATASSRAFPILASTYAVLNGLDIYTTTRAIQSGAGVEANPVVAPMAGNTVAMIAVKAASTTATIVLARRLWKKHPAGAIVLLVAANAGMSIVVAHNASVAFR